LNSEGNNAAEAEGHSARWVAVLMQTPDRDSEAGISILDHLTNLEHSVPWRVDGELGLARAVVIQGQMQVFEDGVDYV